MLIRVDRSEHTFAVGSFLDDGVNVFDGVLSVEEIDMAENLVHSDDVTAAVMDPLGSVIEEWQSACIEGEQRGMFTTVRFDEPAYVAPTVIRLDREAVLRDQFPVGLLSYLFGRVGESADLDPDLWYPLERQQLGNRILAGYTVIIDIPTERIVPFKPLVDPPPPPRTLLDQ